MKLSFSETATRVGLIGIGVFTAVPVMSVFLPEQLESSYGVIDPEPMVLTLLQHRGVFQFLAGAALLWAVFRPSVRIPVAAGVIVAKGSAVLLTITRPEAQDLVNPAIQGIDVACIVVLVAIIMKEVEARRTAQSSVTA